MHTGIAEQRLRRRQRNPHCAGVIVLGKGLENAHHLKLQHVDRAVRGVGEQVDPVPGLQIKCLRHAGTQHHAVGVGVGELAPCGDVDVGTEARLGIGLHALADDGPIRAPIVQQTAEHRAQQHFLNLGNRRQRLPQRLGLLDQVS